MCHCHVVNSQSAECEVRYLNVQVCSFVYVNGRFGSGDGNNFDEIDRNGRVEYKRLGKQKRTILHCWAADEFCQDAHHRRIPFFLPYERGAIHRVEDDCVALALSSPR